ncbi:hypothetical protein ILUMI_13133 [Ignelater luminosus]|uniref:Large ribosomal subunit protein mL42 n=1 Tax=Ignelater luminosus TaxID=2038154 RepID=A0A8K0GB60_IGNLU|nr:hypothetical protein ILUMI_13133 [Ignelater luminosus]
MLHQARHLIMALKNIINNSIFNHQSKLFLSSIRWESTKNPKHTIVLTDDASTFVAWHPKEEFPYECTKPLPEPKLEEDTSVLKTQMTSDMKELFKKKTPEQARQELMNITHTTKHRWFPRARDKKAKKTPMDREYL